MTKPKPDKVELVSNRYQPTKAEKEAEIDFSDMEGKTPEDMARLLTRPVDVSFIPKPRK
ncbi:MAG: hypothetical protein OXU75_14440 [Deltaproteobacteria bacterium]|nr:hypothetical protein [Deltaproteobacteria bacterium]